MISLHVCYNYRLGIVEMLKSGNNRSIIKKIAGHLSITSHVLVEIIVVGMGPLLSVPSCSFIGSYC